MGCNSKADISSHTATSNFLRSSYQIPKINLPLGCTASGMKNQTGILKACWRDMPAWYAAAAHGAQY